jgi:hypothetical protein
VKDNDHTSIASHEVPQILVQTILAYEQNPTLDTHKVFVLRVDRTVLQLSMAVISRTNMEDLYQGKPLRESLRLCCSERYDLREYDQRREVLRVLIGLLRYLDAEGFRG